MVKIENDCVGCSPGMSCIGSACPYRNVQHLYCDECGEEVEKLFVVDDKELCIFCAEQKEKSDEE